MKLTSNEIDLIAVVFRDRDKKILEVSRCSEKEFDLNVTGTYLSGKFSAWLPLATIRNINYIALAHLSDYPAMVLEGDWSSIRDSSPEKIWAMFETAKEWTEF